MAPKRSNEDPLEHPPPASDHSSSDEEGSEEEEEEESSSEGTPPPPPQPKPTSQKPQSSSSDDSDSGSDTDSDAEPTPIPSDKVVVEPKPIEKSPAKAPRSKPPSTPVATKRPSEPESEKKESKRAKKGTKSDGTAEKRRVWSEDDGIAVLKGMIAFQEKNGSAPNSDMNGFHDFVKKSLKNDVSKTQLSDKIRHLKGKYMAISEKVKKDESGSSLKPHESQVFDLAKKIWGESNGSHTVKLVDPQPKPSVKKAKKLKSHGSIAQTPQKPEAPASVDGAKEVVEAMEIDQNLAPQKGLVENLVSDMVQVNGKNIEQYVMQKGLDLIEGSKRAELEERWAELNKAELALFVKRTELLHEQARLALEARK